MGFKRCNLLLLTLVVFLLFACNLFGQLGKGVVSGTVADPSGAVITGATVTLVNQATGTERTITTNSVGLYRFEFTDVGTYSLRVSSQNFSAYEMTGVVLTVGQTVTIDVRLELAKARAEMITV